MVTIGQKSRKSLGLFRVLVSHALHSFLLSVDRSSRQPFERRAKQEQVVLLPRRVMRRTGKIDEYLLVRPKVRVEFPHPLWRYLFVMLAADHKRRDLCLGHHFRVPTPSGDLWRASHTRTPR